MRGASRAFRTMAGGAATLSLALASFAWGLALETEPSSVPSGAVTIDAGDRPPAGEPAAPPEALLQGVRDDIKSGDYDHAIESLKTLIARTPAASDHLRNAYLLLIKTYVFLGNDLKFKPQGRVASNLNYQEARKQIRESLSMRDLRHLRPEPASEYPPEMVTMFSEVRAELFGSFRARFDPAEATVLLQGQALPLIGGGLAGDVDLALGRYTVVVRAPKHQEVTEEIVISPGALLERSYRLSRPRRFKWYALSTAVLAGVVTALASGDKGGGPASSAQKLPDPPFTP